MDSTHPFQNHRLPGAIDDTRSGDTENRIDLAVWHRDTSHFFEALFILKPGEVMKKWKSLF